MDRANKHESKHEHHHSRHSNVDFDDDVTAAKDAWAAWKSHDPAAWDAALDLKNRISPKAWREGMREVDREEAAEKKKCQEALPQVTIHESSQSHPEKAVTGGNTYSQESETNYQQTDTDYQRQKFDTSGSGTNQYQYDNPVTYYGSNVEYRNENISNYYGSANQYRYDNPDNYYYGSGNQYRSYNPDNYYGGAAPYRSYNSDNYYGGAAPYRSYNSDDYYGGSSPYRSYDPDNYYGGDSYYSQRPGGIGLYRHSQIEGWLGPVIGGSAGALFDGRNRWRGTVVGAALGAVIQTVSTGNLGLGYGNYGAGY